MSLREHNYWLTTADFQKTEPRPLPNRVEVAVIGAGFTGLSAARTLAKRGAKVAVLESETIGWGASSRNGGMVLTGLKLGVNKLISLFGRERTQRMYAASLASIDCVEVIAREFNHQLRIVPRGELQSEIGSSIYYGGMVDEISAGLNPARYVAGLAGAAMRSGARICERIRLQTIQHETRE